MEAPSVDWSTAQVSGGKLTVRVNGDRPRGWKQRFERTARLLGDGDWEGVRLKKGEIRVKGVVPGAEDKLRHHLESIIVEANTLAPEPNAPSEPPPAAEDDDDARMTKKFRSFAQREGTPSRA